MKTYTTKARFSRKHLNMITAVVNFCLDTANIAVTTTIAMLLTLVNRLKDNLVAIANLEQAVQNPTGGYANQKKTARVTCTEISLSVMKACFTFSIETGNEILQSQMSTSRSALLALSDTDFEAFTRNAYNKALPYQPDLVNYGVTLEEFELWHETIQTFKNVMTKPSGQRAIKNQSKREIQNLLRASMLMLYNQIDLLVFQLKDSHPAYFTTYLLSRKLRPLVKHTKFRVRITNELGEPIYNVKVQQDNTDRIAHTDMIGEATIMVEVERDPQKQPVYSFTITNGTQTIHTGNIQINLGHTVTQFYIMQPSGFILPEPVSETVETPA